jgi:putative acetyltransferase
MNESDITIGPALSKSDQRAVKALFIEYSNWLPVNLDFQDFNMEMNVFPKGYDCLLLAKRAGTPVGAVGLRAHNKTTCEMKRLFIKQEAQGLGLGRSISLHLMQEAKALGFQEMVLDSLKRLKPAVKLYRSLGFTEIEPYNFNPEDDVIYMRRDL